VATPPESEAVPRVVLPSRNVTVPLAAVGEVVAVSVTLAPATGEVVDAVRAVVVAIVWAVTVTAIEVLAE
jgi:hypothetical protein